MWFEVSATIERITVSSSATSPRWGNRSETHRPLCPRCRNAQSGRRSRPTWPKKTSGLVDDLKRLAVRRDQARLVVKRIDMAHRPAQADVNGTSRLGREVGTGRARLAGLTGLQRAVAQHQRRGGRAGQAVPHPGEEVATIHDDAPAGAVNRGRGIRCN